MNYFVYPLLILFFSLPVFSQSNGNNVEAVRKGDKTLAKIPVVISDREGRRIAGLEKEDFTITKGGIPQEIVSFGTEREPVSVALLIDTSGSTQDVLDKIKDAAKDFIDLLNPGDQCLIATFDSQINFLISFTSNTQNLKDSLSKIKTADKDGTVLFTAINQLTASSFGRVKGRKAIIVLSDGRDYGSAITKNELLGELNESDVSIYPIYYESGTGFVKPLVKQDGTVVESSTKSEPKKKVKKPKKKKNVYSVLIPLPGDTYTPEEIKLLDKIDTTNAITALKEMSDLTAGRFYVSDAGKLNTIFKQVATELKQEYSLGFYTNQPVDESFYARRANQSQSSQCRRSNARQTEHQKLI